MTAPMKHRCPVVGKPKLAPGKTTSFILKARQNGVAPCPECGRMIRPLLKDRVLRQFLGFPPHNRPPEAA